MLNPEPITLNHKPPTVTRRSAPGQRLPRPVNLGSGGDGDPRGGDPRRLQREPLRDLRAQRGGGPRVVFDRACWGVRQRDKSRARPDAGECVSE